MAAGTGPLRQRPQPVRQVEQRFLRASRRPEHATAPLRTATRDAGMPLTGWMRKYAWSLALFSACRRRRPEISLAASGAESRTADVYTPPVPGPHTRLRSGIATTPRRELVTWSPTGYIDPQRCKQMLKEGAERATAHRDDWLGSVAMDNPQDGLRVIAEYARIDVSRWLIYRIELFGSGLVDGSWASVLAVDRLRIEAAGSIAALAEEYGGSVPVTRFRVLDSDGIGVLRAMKRWSVRVSPGASGAENRPVYVERTADDPSGRGSSLAARGPGCTSGNEAGPPLW